MKKIITITVPVYFNRYTEEGLSREEFQEEVANKAKLLQADSERFDDFLINEHMDALEAYRLEGEERAEFDAKFARYCADCAEEELLDDDYRECQVKTAIEVEIDPSEFETDSAEE